MYIPQRITDELSHQIERFFDDLAQKPYCADEKNYIVIRQKSTAITMKYIQPNPVNVMRWLVLDIDNPQALYAHHDNHAPPPQLIVVNPQNGHAHLFYRLRCAVGRRGNSSIKAEMYAVAVYNALAKKLGADMGYSGNICKNPASDAWLTYAPNDAPHDYDLGELADWLELDSWHSTAKAIKKESANDSAFGRNVSLFHGIRRDCYALASRYSGRSLYSAIIALADEYNTQFNDPLPSNEVMNTARSIYRYCSSARFKAAKTASDARFSALQAQRGSKGGAKSKRGKSEQSERTQQPWLALGISRKTYYKRKKNNTL